MLILIGKVYSPDRAALVSLSTVFLVIFRLPVLRSFLNAAVTVFPVSDMLPVGFSIFSNSLSAVSVTVQLYPASGRSGIVTLALPVVVTVVFPSPSNVYPPYVPVSGTLPFMTVTVKVKTLFVASAGIGETTCLLICREVVLMLFVNSAVLIPSVSPALTVTVWRFTLPSARAVPFVGAVSSTV